MKKSISIKNAPAPVGPYSQAILHNNMLYASGQIAINPKTNELIIHDLSKEVNQVMENIASLLQAAEMNWNDVIKCSIFLKDMNNFELVNDIYASYFNKSFPARETVEVSRLPKDVNVEISFIAGKD
ncbi:MAG: Rid family detoxifying hydrolase [Flavobacteriales bacterium]|nr:Rid family detoxifying hydrolase [Flavobacteriales bacterium]